MSILKRKHFIPLQSNVFTFKSEHPYIQDPLKASQCRSLQSVEHELWHPEEYLSWSHPETNNQFREIRQVLCACDLIFFFIKTADLPITFISQISTFV